MGNGRSSPSPIRIPVYLPSFRFSEIDRKKAELERLKNDVNNLNWQIDQEKATLDKITSERNDWSNDVTEKTHRISQLTNERDELIQKQNELTIELEKLQTSLELANQQADAPNNQMANLSKIYVGKTVDTIKTKEELYDAIKIQNNLILDSKTNTWKTSDRRANYENEHIGVLSMINIVMFIIYFSLVAIFIYILYYLKPSVNKYIRIVYALGLILFPFVVMKIEYLVYYFFYFIFKKLNVDRIFL
jgi:hypothetical protein